MTAVEGDFKRGDLVACVTADGREVARGLANYTAAEARCLLRRSSEDIEAQLGYAHEAEFIHRDNMILSTTQT